MSNGWDAKGLSSWAMQPVPRQPKPVSQIKKMSAPMTFEAAASGDAAKEQINRRDASGSLQKYLDPLYAEAELCELGEATKFSIEVKPEELLADVQRRAARTAPLTMRSPISSSSAPVQAYARAGD